MNTKIKIGLAALAVIANNERLSAIRDALNSVETLGLGEGHVYLEAEDNGNEFEWTHGEAIRYNAPEYIIYANLGFGFKNSGCDSVIDPVFNVDEQVRLWHK